MSIPTAADKKVAQKIEADKKEIERLRTQCSDYLLHKKQWDLYLNAYEGGTDFANQTNLHKHPREHPQDYSERVTRLHYQNFCDVLVEFFTDFIFAETIQRDGGVDKDWYNKFLLDVNKKGEDITTFMKDVSDEKDIFGMIYGLVDAPVVNRRLTKLEENQLGIRPYWVLVRPTEIFDWVVDSFDQFLYVKRQQLVDDYQNNQRVSLERYTEWTPTDITITDIDVTDEGAPVLRPATKLANKLNEVPIRVARYRRSKKNRFMGKSFLTDLAYDNREVMNLTSLEQEFLYRQCFSILATEADTSVPLADQQQGNVGTANTLLYPKGAKVPAYIAPSSEPAKYISDAKQRLINEMYKRAAQDTLNELFNGGKSSGFSKSQSFKTTVPRIATRADALEHFENEMMDLTMRYMKRKWVGTVKYKDHYEITNLTDALAQMTTLFKDLQLPSETFVKTELKRMVHEFDGKISTDDMIKIMKEIDGMNFPEWADTQKLAYLGRAALAPEAKLAIEGTAPGPVKGKDTPTAASTPQRAGGTSSEIAAESRSA